MPSFHQRGYGRAGHTRAYCVTALLLLLTLLACAPSGAAQARPPGGVAERMLVAVNEARSTARVCGDTSYAPSAPLKLEARLTAAAQLHSQDMLATGALSHVGSDGSSMVDRAERQGYPWSRLAENVAWGYDDVSSVVAGWLGSPGHCRNIMSPDYRELGVGVAGTFWTQAFGTQR